MLDILALAKDGFAQQRLLEGLEDPQKALLPPEKALQLLSYDIHAGAYAAAHDILEAPPNPAAKLEALRILSADAGAAPLFESILRNKSETPEIRQLAAAALFALRPESLLAHAREIVLDDSEQAEIQATSLTALNFSDPVAMAGDQALRQRIESLSRGASLKRRKTPAALAQGLAVGSPNSRAENGGCANPGCGQPVDGSGICGRRRHPHRECRPVRAADRAAARRSSGLRPARRGDRRADARLGPAGAGAPSAGGRSAALRARGARHRTRSLPRRGGRPGAAVLPGALGGAGAFVLRAFSNIRYRDEPVSFEGYGESAVARGETTPVREVFAALAWLGPAARNVLGELETLRQGGLPKKPREHVDGAIEAIGADGRGQAAIKNEACCTLPSGVGAQLSWAFRRGTAAIDRQVFEDQEGNALLFEDFFRGCPSIVAFFYTRCDNPQKCSLTVTKLARIQKSWRSGGWPSGSTPRRSPTIRFTTFPGGSAPTGKTAGCASMPTTGC